MILRVQCKKCEYMSLPIEVFGLKPEDVFSTTCTKCFSNDNKDMLIMYRNLNEYSDSELTTEIASRSDKKASRIKILCWNCNGSGEMECTREACIICNGQGWKMAIKYEEGIYEKRC